MDAINLGSIKFLFKYCEERASQLPPSRLLHRQQAEEDQRVATRGCDTAASHPRHEAQSHRHPSLPASTISEPEPSRLSFRLDGMLSNASALDVAAFDRLRARCEGSG